MKYYLYEEQNGGCDYTIGCGKRLREIPNALSFADALRIIREPDKYGESMLNVRSRERAPDRASILAVADGLPLDLTGMRLELERADRLEAAKQKEEAERAEYDRLQAKFGVKK